MATLIIMTVATGMSFYLGAKGLVDLLSKLDDPECDIIHLPWTRLMLPFIVFESGAVYGVHFMKAGNFLVWVFLLAGANLLMMLEVLAIAVGFGVYYHYRHPEDYVIR